MEGSSKLAPMPSVRQRRLATRATLLALAPALFAAPISAQSSTPEPDFEAVQRLVSSNMPVRGSIEAVFVAQLADARWLVGCDARSEAFYSINSGRVLARDPTGTLFGGNPAEGGLTTEGSIVIGASDVALDEVFPFVFLRGVIRRADAVRSVASLEPGGYRLTMSFTLGNRLERPERFPAGFDTSSSDNVIEIDGSGRLVSVYNDRSKRTLRPRYAEDSPPGFWVSKTAGWQDGWVLSSIAFKPDGDPGLFSFEHVESLAAQEEARRSDASRAGRERPNQPGSGNGTAGSGRASRDKALIGAGVVVLVVAAGAWIRHRR